MKEHHVGVDTDGNPLAYTSDQVKDIVRNAMEHGDVLMAVLRTESGDLACQVFGPPSEEIADMVEAFARAYRAAIRTPEHKGQ